MKTLFESIKANVGIGRFKKGTRTVEDDVPCTVIGIEDGYLYLLSDSFGYKSGKPCFIADKDLVLDNDIKYYSWDSCGCGFLRTPDGWRYPNLKECKTFSKEISKYVLSSNSISISFVILVNLMDDRASYIYPYNLKHDVTANEDSTCGIRFIKKIKIK